MGQTSDTTTAVMSTTTETLEPSDTSKKNPKSHNPFHNYGWRSAPTNVAGSFYRKDKDDDAVDERAFRPKVGSGLGNEGVTYEYAMLEQRLLREEAEKKAKAKAEKKERKEAERQAAKESGSRRGSFFGKILGN